MKNAKILTKEDLKRYKQPLPQSWKKAAGLLKGKKVVDPVAYQRGVRAEWEKRLKKLSV